MIYSWQKARWKELTGDLDRLHHALLLAGPAGVGKLDFALALAQRLLCQQPDEEGYGCGKCPACGWFLAENHPDFRRVYPQSLAEQENSQPATEAPGADSKQPSTLILIDQVRDLSNFVSIATHQAGRRVILLHPAEAMHAPTANALLKLLEEPPSSVYFILVTSAESRLAATVRSRCRRVAFGKPDETLGREWLRQAGVAQADAAWAAAGGMPLEAAKWMQPEFAALHAWFVAEVSKGSEIDPLAAASVWESRMREGNLRQQGAIALVVGWLQKWLFDLIVSYHGTAPVYFGEAVAALKRIAARASRLELIRFWQQLLRIRGMCEHPLNSRLLMEDVMIRYSWAVSRPTER